MLVSVMALHGLTLSVDMEVVTDLFVNTTFRVMRQVDEGFTSLKGQWNLLYSPIFMDEEEAFYSTLIVCSKIELCLLLVTFQSLSIHVLFILLLFDSRYYCIMLATGSLA